MENEIPKPNLKQTVINNVNIVKNPITGIMGSLIILVGLGTIIAPLVIIEKSDIPDWTGWVLLLLGISVLLAPDKVISLIFKIADKKADGL